MRDSSKVSKFGITISSVAVIISAIYTLYNFIKGTPVSSVALISCITILFANIAVAQQYKKKKANKF
jgi:hypothetical protein